MKTFTITEEFIPLIQLLKATRIAQSGGEAQIFVVQNIVKVNGQLETRKRAKIRHGDIVSCLGKEILVQVENDKK